MTKRAMNKLNKLMKGYEVETVEELIQEVAVDEWEDPDVDGKAYELVNGEVVVVLNNGEAYVE